MPSKEELRLAIGNESKDLRSVRLPGLDKPFDELTGSDRVQVRPGTEVADAYLGTGSERVRERPGPEVADAYILDDTGSDSGFSSVLDELGELQKTRA